MYGRRYEPTNTILDHTAGPAPPEYATTAISRSNREHHQSEMQSILAHVGADLDTFITGGAVAGDDDGGGGRAGGRVDRTGAYGQHQTTAVVGSGLYEPKQELTEQEQALYDATAAEAARTSRGFEVRLACCSRSSVGCGGESERDRDRDRDRETETERGRGVEQGTVTERGRGGKGTV